MIHSRRAGKLQVLYERSIFLTIGQFYSQSTIMAHRVRKKSSLQVQTAALRVRKNEKQRSAYDRRMRIKIRRVRFAIRFIFGFVAVNTLLPANVYFLMNVQDCNLNPYNNRRIHSILLSAVLTTLLSSCSARNTRPTQIILSLRYNLTRYYHLSMLTYMCEWFFQHTCSRMR